jgi:hypothetical protein
MSEIGVDRYYVQEMDALEAIDLDRLESVFGALKGA